MSYYADSSFLVSCYVVDTHTPRAKRVLSDTHAPLVFTALHALEVRNALQLGVFRRHLSAAEAEFLSFDPRQLALAAAIRLKVAQPES
jgi:hypothetical protein